MTNEERNQILAEAYANVAGLEGVEERWAAEAAEREGRRYWETQPEMKPSRRERRLDTSPHQSEVHTRDLASAPVLTAEQIQVLGAALSEIRKQMRDEIEVARVEIQTIVSAMVRDEIDALRKEVASLRDKNLVVLPRREYNDAA